MTDGLKLFFSIFHLFTLTISNCFCQRSYEKTTHFHNDYQKLLELPTLSQRFDIWKFLTIKRWPFKKMKKLHFLVADFENRKKEKKFNSANLSNIAKGTLILKDCGVTSYPCSNYGSSNLQFCFNNSCKVVDLESL